VLRNKPIASEVAKLRAGYTTLGYCFSDEAIKTALDALATTSGL